MTTAKLKFNLSRQLNSSRDGLDNVVAKLYSALGMLDDLPSNDVASSMAEGIHSAIHSISLANELIDDVQYNSSH